MIQAELPSFSPELAQRTPNCIDHWLRNLWVKHTGSSHSFVTEPAWLSRPAKDYSSYDIHNYEVVLALEFLHRNGKVKNAGEIIERGRLKENLTSAGWKGFIEQVPLKDLKVGVIGGLEARIFAEMGARAVGFDPHLNMLPEVKLPNLEEQSVYFNKLLAQKYAGRFDLTFSSWLFDQGSGLTDFSLLTDILAMTKKGGFSIHNGNLMSKIVQDSLLIDEVVAIVPSSNKYKLGDSPVYFVLQKR